ncbi:cephalosporin hydroxylase family protein [Candidatus Babeliales bacterium]|nr:cephalosporin hydroxylase family protein [Candidatus Babeliales bacterium]
MDLLKKFNKEKSVNNERLSTETNIKDVSLEWLAKTYRYRYPYNFSWLGVPIIQYPQDIMAMQEIIWSVQPDLIIETGIAHGGSLLFYASMLELLGGDRRVIGVDINLKKHNRDIIEAHPHSQRISMVEGSSSSEQVFKEVEYLARGRKKILVCLDSSHAHAHVLKELELYSPFVSQGSYLVVFDTLVEILPDTFFEKRSWSKGDNPYSAVQEFLKTNTDFEVDTKIDQKLLITANPQGYLKRIN